MPDPKPKLVAVDSTQDTGTSNQMPQQRRRGADLGAWFWLLAVVLVIAVAIIASQTRRLDRLSTQVEALETQLNTANGTLRGYEGRFGEIRESVGNLRTQLGELEGLVDQAPAPAL